MASKNDSAPQAQFQARNLWWLCLSLSIIALDLWTKQLASTQLEYARPVEILPVLNFTLLHNPGAAWSFLADAGGWQRWFFTAVSLIVSIVLVVWLSRLQASERWLAIALALILGGAVGNLYDRMTLGYVVDFISVHYKGSYFPAFNIADSAISVGAAVMIADMFFGPSSRKPSSPDDEAAR